MTTATTPAATSIVADTAALESVFRALLADLTVDPRRLLDGAALAPTVERTATPGLFLVPSATTPDAAYRVQNGLCNCLDAQRRDARRCKHALAVAAFQLLERAEAEAGQPVDPADADEEIPYALTARAIAVLEPTRECAACPCLAEDHDGPEGQCVRQGVDAEGLWVCACRGFQVDDPDAA
jgi:hypothetical protein